MQQALEQQMLAHPAPALQHLSAELVGSLQQRQQWQGQRGRTSRHMPFTHINDVVGGAGRKGGMREMPAACTYDPLKSNTNSVPTKPHLNPILRCTTKACS